MKNEHALLPLLLLLLPLLGIPLFLFVVPRASCALTGLLWRFVKTLGPIRSGFIGPEPGVYNYGACVSASTLISLDLPPISPSATLL